MTNRERAAQMTEAGLNTCDIGRYLGVNPSTVWKWLHPDEAREANRRDREKRREARRAEDRARHLRSKRLCPHCGTTMESISEACQGCADARATVRASLIQGMWADGWKLSEIADALATTTNSLGAKMNKMRRQGWDLPHRYRVAA